MIRKLLCLLGHHRWSSPILGVDYNAQHPDLAYMVTVRCCIRCGHEDLLDLTWLTSD